MALDGEGPTPVPVSALQHTVYCPRQCALIHVERVFEENVHTLRGQSVHKRVDEATTEFVDDLRIERALPLWSELYGLIGKADVVEFGADGVPYPVEYKHGRAKKASATADAVQLCAQALCLEEMTGLSVPKGALYFHSSHKRQEIIFDEKLRARTIETIKETRSILDDHRIPPPVADKRCDDCSLARQCEPGLTALKRIDIFRPIPEVE